jgi:hypothetical protein
LPDQEQKGIDSLIESFAQVRHVEDLQGEVKLCDWALNKLSSYRGAGELIASAFAEGENRGWTTEEIMQNSRLAYVLPQTNIEHLMRTVKAYERGGEEWKAMEPDVRLTWRALISGAREKWQTALAEHDKLYPNWKHEKEASAFAELVARHLNRTNKDRWKDIQYDMGNLKNYNVDLE